MSVTLAPVTQVLLDDDFSTNAPLDPAVWDFNHYAAVNNPSYYGRTEVEQYLPVVSGGALQLTLQTTNPTPPGTGNSFLGSEIISKQTFDDSVGGIAFTAVAALGTAVPGMVGGMFGYNYDATTALHNEVDFELLSNDAAAGNDQVQTNVYRNAPLGAGDFKFVADPGLTTYHTYTIEWFSDRTLWFIDGQVVRDSTSNVPQGPLAFHLNFWAPDTAWGAAYSSSLLPTSTAEDNAVYTFDVRSVSVAEIACFAAGTRIATPTGERAIETLAEGDMVVTASGATRPVVWIGHRRVDCRCHPRRHDVVPIRVRAGAFGRGRPHRDLVLSPDHAVFADGVLIPIRYLINGATIVQENVATVTYYHLELPTHEVILAEGLSCESYLDTGNRAAFANGGAAMLMFPGFARAVWATKACAELVLCGPRLAAVKRRLLHEAMTAGREITRDADLRIMVDGRVAPVAIDGRTWRARLPPQAKSVRLVSRTWVPAHMRPDATDARRLGVAISGLRIDGRVLPLGDATLSSGWHTEEPGWRWTDGDAGLAVNGWRDLSFEVAMTGSYWTGQRAERRRIA